MWALLCAIVIILITLSLYILNNMFESDITGLQAEIDKNTSQVTLLNEDSSLLQVSHLLQTNSSIIQKLEQQSQIVSYINHLRQTSSTYNLDIEGFEYSGEQIWVSVTSTSKTGGKAAYQNVVALLRKYDDSKAALFRLDNIASISWHDSIRFAVNFLIK